jgi:hypothetical protein
MLPFGHGAPDARIQPTLPELGLVLGRQLHVAAVELDGVDQPVNVQQRLLERSWERRSDLTPPRGFELAPPPSEGVSTSGALSGGEGRPREG